MKQPQATLGCGKCQQVAGFIGNVCAHCGASIRDAKWFPQTKKRKK